MRAIRVPEYGEATVLTAVDVPAPTVDETEVRIDVAVAGDLADFEPGEGTFPLADAASATSISKIGERGERSFSSPETGLLQLCCRPDRWNRARPVSSGRIETLTCQFAQLPTWTSQ